MFTQKISMDCTREQYERHLRGELLKMGYEEQTVYWGREIKIFTNAANGVAGKMLDIDEEEKERFNRTYLGEFNAELFLALAAMTDNERVFGYREWAKQKNGNDFQLPLVGENCNPYWRKATKEEIMAKFKPSQETFSVGDYITITTPREHKLLGILSSRDVRRGDSGVQVLAGLNIAGVLELDTSFGVQIPDKIRHSTEEEKEKLNQSLESTGQYFDLQELKIKSKKIETKMKTIKVTRGDLQRVHQVACSDWKDRIESYVRKYGTLFSDEIFLPEGIVEEMFKAATPDQKKVLMEVFPGYSKSRDSNPWRDSLTPEGINRLEKLVQEFNDIIGAANLLYVAKGLADNVPHLKRRAFAVNSFYNVKLHKGMGDTTLIEFITKD